MLNTQERKRFFARQDDRPPVRTPPMHVRQRWSRVLGPYTITLETSMGLKDTDTAEAGAVRLIMHDARDNAESIARFQCESWREAEGEYHALIRTCLRERGRPGLTIAA